MSAFARRLLCCFSATFRLFPPAVVVLLLHSCAGRTNVENASNKIQSKGPFQEKKKKKKQKRACFFTFPPCFYPSSLALCGRSLGFFLSTSSPPTVVFCFPPPKQQSCQPPSLVHIAPGSPLVGLPLLLNTSSVSEHGASDHFCLFVVVSRSLVKVSSLLVCGYGPWIRSFKDKDKKKSLANHSDKVS